MIENIVFYKILGIDEAIIEPTYYHLLGLEPKDCTAQRVCKALRQKQKELRQNIPGPQFIPLVIKFEQEYLIPAAEVLCDEDKRQQYDKQLLKKQKIIEQQQQKSLQLITQVRKLVADSVGSDGTLDAAGKVELAAKLRQLGVDETNVAVILSRIPNPNAESGKKLGKYSEFFMGAVALAVSEGTLSVHDYEKLIVLAERLGIEREKAVKAIEFVTGSSRQVISKLESGGDGLIELQNPAFKDHSLAVELPASIKQQLEMEQKQDESEDELIEGEELEQKRLDEFINFVVPLVCIAVFVIVTVFFIGRAQKPAEDTSDVPERQAPAEPKTGSDKSCRKADSHRHC